jgi:hypothetical protein
MTLTSRARHASHHQNYVHIRVPVEPVLAIWAPQIISEPQEVCPETYGQTFWGRKNTQAGPENVSGGPNREEEVKLVDGAKAGDQTDQELSGHHTSQELD